MKPREGGFALLIVLWSVVLLALLATGITARGRSDIQLAANLRGAAVAEAAADGAVQAAAFHLLDPAEPWQADGQQRETQVPGAIVSIRIEDEAGKINPNTASLELLRALLQAVGANQQQSSGLAASIVEWRFPRGARPGGLASAPLIGPPPAPDSGAAMQRYRSAGLDYGPPGAPFETMRELGLVLGMTPALLASITPYLSLLNDTDPDPRRAAPVVLQAISEAVGPIPAKSGPPPPTRIVTVTAVAQTPSGSRFTRHAALRLGRSRKEPLITVVDWQPGR